MRLIHALAFWLCLFAPAHAGRYLDLITAAAASTRPVVPTPPPSPSGECSNCDGTGILGDGTVKVKCPVCNGTGKITSTESAPAAGTDLNIRVTQPFPNGAPAAEAELSADQQPTPMGAIGDALRVLNPRGKVFLDIGAGFDCRAGIVAVRDFGAARVIAIEKDPAVAESARRYVEHAGLGDRIAVLTADAAALEFPAGAVGYAYLFEEELVKLRPKLQKLDAFVSFAHPVPGLTTPQGELHVYRKPTATAVMQQFRQAAPRAVYNGRTYSRPVCNRAGCSMCNAIRRQLGRW